MYFSRLDGLWDSLLRIWCADGTKEILIDLSVSWSVGRLDLIWGAALIGSYRSGLSWSDRSDWMDCIWYRIELLDWTFSIEWERISSGVSPTVIEVFLAHPRVRVRFAARGFDVDMTRMSCRPPNIISSFEITAWWNNVKTWRSWNEAFERIKDYDLGFILRMWCLYFSKVYSFKCREKFLNIIMCLFPGRILLYVDPAQNIR